MTLNSKILKAFGLSGKLQLIAQRENLVYRAGDWAIRAHRPNYRTFAEIEAELSLLAILNEANCEVPKPGVAQNIDDQIYSSVSWINGKTLSELSNIPLDIFKALGHLLKKIQRVPVPRLQRPIWDVDAILGEAPLWGRWQDHPDLTTEQYKIFSLLRSCPTLPELQLVHGDALRENVMVIGNIVYLIDFDDCAYSYPSFDIATILAKEWQNRSYEDIKNALLIGYGSVAERELSFMLALRALTYVGWVKDRIMEPNIAAKSQEVLDRAEYFARHYIESV